jgi:hypothetical protein
MTEAAVDLMGNRHRIACWIRGLWADDVEANPDKLALRHVAVSDRQVDVASFGVANKPADDQDALLSRIEQALENDADGLGGVQKYVLLALREGRPLSRLPLRVASSFDDGGSSDSLDSEPANSKGLLAQLMRHNEVQSRMFAMSMGQVVSTMQRTISRLQEENELADERRLAAVSTAEQLLSKGHERAAITQMVEDNRVARTATFNTIKAAVPFLLQYLRAGIGDPSVTGAPSATGAPSEATSVGKLVSELASSLKPDQLLGLQNLLTPEQMEIIEKILAASPVPGGDDAVGDEKQTKEPEATNG